MPQLAGILARADLDSLVLDTTDSMPLELAERMRFAVGWTCDADEAR